MTDDQLDAMRQEVRANIVPPAILAEQWKPAITVTPAELAAALRDVALAMQQAVDAFASVTLSVPLDSGHFRSSITALGHYVHRVPVTMRHARYQHGSRR